MKVYFSRSIILAIPILIFGCMTIQQDWKSARSTDTVQAYEEFLQDHPSGELADQARFRIEEMLKDLSEWEKALRLDTIEGYQGFLDQYPGSPFAEKAERKIVDLEVADIVIGEHEEAPAASNSVSK